MTSRPGTAARRGLARIAAAGAIAVGATAALSGTANAAPESAWDRLAQCESSGNWQANTGNGYYGGLQFSLSTWRAYGGSGMPHQASKAQQIAVAERTLAGQGWNAWPQCSHKAGVRGNSAQPARATTRAAAPAPAAAAPARSSSNNGADYTVRAGDTLSKIASREGVGGGWKALYQRNADVLSNPNVLRIGQQLDLR